MITNRRSFAAIAGVSALGWAGLRTFSAAAQSESPYTFGDGSVLTWADPWTLRESFATEGFGEFAALIAGQATLSLGTLSTPMTIDDAMSQAGISGTTVSGSEFQTTDANGTVISEGELRLTLWKDDSGQAFSVLAQLIDGVKLTVLYATVDELAAFVASGQAVVALDGVPVFDGVGQDDLQADLAYGVELIASGEEPPVVAAQAGSGGEYTDGSGKHLVPCSLITRASTLG